MTQLKFTWLAEGAGEEDPSICADGATMNISAAQWCIWRISKPALDVEGDAQRGRIGLRHLHPLERDIEPVRRSWSGAWDEPEGQEHTGQWADDHRAHRDLAEHEDQWSGRPSSSVVDALGGAEAVIRPAGHATEES